MRTAEPNAQDARARTHARTHDRHVRALDSMYPYIRYGKLRKGAEARVRDLPKAARVHEQVLAVRAD
jgi:hypothetical protein